MRVVIRFSLNKDHGSALRNTLKAILEQRNIIWTGKTTGTYEGYADEADVRLALTAFWKAVELSQNGVVDHFWMYTDRKPAPSLDDLDL